jgi:hypothetical protein
MTLEPKSPKPVQPLRKPSRHNKAGIGDNIDANFT